MKRILIISYYFWPDMAPPAFRMKGLVSELDKCLSNSEITVVCGESDRFNVRRSELDSEFDNRLNLHRLNVPPYRGGTVSQSWAYLVFCAKVIVFCARRDDQIIVVTSARLGSSLLGYFISKLIGSKLYCDVRDLFIENLVDFKSPPSWLVSLLTVVEQRVMRSAAGISLASSGFVEYFEKIVKPSKLKVFTNGVDDLGSHNLSIKPPDVVAEILSAMTHSEIVYVGNIGNAQGLHNLIPKLANFTGSESWHFTIIGNGPCSSELNSQVKSLSNVKTFEPVPREFLPLIYEKAKVLLIHLDEYESLSKVIPSKIFEYAASGKPILAGLPRDGVAEIVSRDIHGCYLFSPLDTSGAYRQLASIKHSKTQSWSKDREAFVKSYQRNHICARFAADVVAKV